jgi:type III restriction enzyme
LKLPLKDFQASTVDRLYSHARPAKREAEEGGEQALVLASPTGSGKTMIATALMERIVEGDGDHEPDEHAMFLWLSDQPDLNEQSRRKILDGSSVFGSSELVTIDADFDREHLDPGNVYFLNIQKLGRGTHLVTPGDERKFTIWETVTNTIAAAPGSLWLVLDEAHKGMLERREAEHAATIVQKFVKGSPGEVPAIPLILGISATPDRFVEVLKGTVRVRREVTVDPEDVRASGLLKETIVLFHPTGKQPSDWSLLRASAEKLKRFRQEWGTYCAKEAETTVVPVLVIQVEDAGEGRVTRTDLDVAISTVEDVLGPLSEEEVAHCFQEGYAIEVGNRVLRYVSPADVQDDGNLRMVFFKLSLNTGWDCPRAEVIMSFRRAVDYTHIAQLVGRLVRAPLARSITANDFLNSVALYLPHYDRKALKTVVDYLSKPETGVAAPPAIVEGDQLLDFPRDETKEELFALAETLPTYSIERISKTSNMRRLVRLGRALAYDKLEAEAHEGFRDLIVSLLDEERLRQAKTAAFKKALKERAEIDVRGVKIKYRAGEDIPDESFEAVAAVAENIDDLYTQSGRRLGEGLHAAYLKARVATGKVRPAQAKLELATLLDSDSTVRLMENETGKVFRGVIEKHKAAIRRLPETRRDVYRRLRRQAEKPEPEELELPDVYEAPKGDRRLRLHLYVDDSGDFRCKLNEWEVSVVEAELHNEEIVGWLRNAARKNWALKVPYTYGGEDHPMYPDFLFFRRHGSGIVVDILEPHSLSYDDSAAKAKGLADFALRHGDLFGRIELIFKKGNDLVRLDVNRVDLRDKVRAVSSNEHLRQLFDASS